MVALKKVLSTFHMELCLMTNAKSDYMTWTITRLDTIAHIYPTVKFPRCTSRKLLILDLAHTVFALFIVLITSFCLTTAYLAGLKLWLQT